MVTSAREGILRVQVADTGTRTPTGGVLAPMQITLITRVITIVMATQLAHLEGIMPIEEGFQTGLQRTRALALVTRLP